MSIGAATRQLTAEMIADPKTFRSKICEAIRRTDGNVTEAARILGVSRRTMHRYLAEDPYLCDAVDEARVANDDGRVRGRVG